MNKKLHSDRDDVYRPDIVDRQSHDNDDAVHYTDREPLLTRIGPLLEEIQKSGNVDPDFDMKAYLDEMWGDI